LVVEGVDVVGRQLSGVGIGISIRVGLSVVLCCADTREVRRRVCVRDITQVLAEDSITVLMRTIRALALEGEQRRL
jgi:hypothetical protein